MTGSIGRYTTSGYHDAQETARTLADVIQRIERVERTGQMSYTSIDGGSMDVYDDEGNLVMVIGNQHDGTSGAVPVMGPVPPIPTRPTLTPVSGGLLARWDGLFVNNALVPMDFARVEVHASTTPGFVPALATTLRDTIESPRGGEVAIFTDENVPYYVAFVARATTGQASAGSEQASATPLPVVTYSVLQGLSGQGIFYQDNAPTGLGPSSTGTWFDTNNDYAPYRWSGTAWVPYQFGGAALADGSIIAAKLAAGAVTAAKITAGAIEADKLSIGAVTAGASRLLNFTMEAPNADGTGILGWALRPITGAPTLAVETLAPLSGTRSARVTTPDAAAAGRLVSLNPIAVEPGSTWSVTASVRLSRAVASDATLSILAMTSDTAGGVETIANPATAWTSVVEATGAVTPVSVRAKFTVPATARYLTIGLVSAAAADGAGGYSTTWDNVVLQTVIPGVAIEDGAVTAEHLAADSVTAGAIVAGTVTGDELAGEIILGSQISTPDVDDSGVPIPYTTIGPLGIETLDVDEATGARNVVARIPNTRGTPPFLNGNLIGSSFSGTNVSIGGTGNEFARESLTLLATGTSNPIAAPNVSEFYPSFKIPVGDPQTGSLGTFAIDFKAVVWATSRPTDGAYALVHRRPTGSRLWWVSAADGSYITHRDYPAWDVYSLADNGSRFWFTGYNTNSRRWYVRDSVNGWNTISPGDEIPAVGIDPADPVGRVWVFYKSAGRWYLRQGSVSTTTGAAFVFTSTARLTGAVHATHTNSLSIGTFDYTDGLKRMFTNGGETVAAPTRLYNFTTGASRPTEDFPPVGAHSSVIWNPIAGQFYELGTDGTLYAYSGNSRALGAQTVTWWFGLTLYDPNTGTGSTPSPPTNDGTHETMLGVLRRFPVSQRAQIRVSLPPLPRYVSPTPDDPTQWRVYVARSTATTAPAAATFHQQAQGGAGVVVIDGVSDTAPTPPTVNNFPTARPAIIASSAVRVDGSPRLDIRGDGYTRLDGLIPPGTLIEWSGVSTPTGWLIANGTAVSRATYSELADRYFDGVNYRHGNGDGSTTFNLPNMISTAQTVDPTNAFTASTGWALDAQDVRRMGRQVYVMLTARRTGATISVGASGNWGNQEIAQATTGYAANPAQPLVSGAAGPARVFQVYSGGAVSLVSAAGSDTISTGDTFTFGGNYLASADLPNAVRWIVKV